MSGHVSQNLPHEASDLAIRDRVDKVILWEGLSRFPPSGYTLLAGVVGGDNRGQRATNVRQQIAGEGGGHGRVHARVDRIRGCCVFDFLAKRMGLHQRVEVG